MFEDIFHLHNFQPRVHQNLSYTCLGIYSCFIPEKDERSLLDIGGSKPILNMIDVSIKIHEMLVK